MSYSKPQAVTASKGYTCLWCGERIAFRERYIRQTCADGPRHWRNRWHAECWQAWLHLPHDEQDWWNDEGCVPKYARGLTVLKEHMEFRYPEHPVGRGAEVILMDEPGSMP